MKLVLVEAGKTLEIIGYWIDISERKRAEQALLERENELEIKTKNLEEVNTALKVLLKRRDEEKTDIEERILLNMKERVIPYLEKLKKSGLDEKQKIYVGILESNLNDVILPFSQRLSSMYLNLTPTEIQIANLLRQGKTNKEIVTFFTKNYCLSQREYQKEIRIKKQKDKSQNLPSVTNLIQFIAGNLLAIFWY